VLAISLEERTEIVAFARQTETIPPPPPLLSTAAPVKHNLPPQPTSFIGRADDLAQIAERLADPACRLLTLVGAGGINTSSVVSNACCRSLSRILEDPAALAVAIPEAPLLNFAVSTSQPP